MPRSAALGHHQSTTPFARWLLSQADRTDAIGTLAKNASRDPAFPREGSVDAVSCRLNSVGADADMHEALEQAELDWAAY